MFQKKSLAGIEPVPIQRRRIPVAPAAFRPQPMPLVLQLKTASERPGPFAAGHRAPPVYHPQPVPKALQPKTAVVNPRSPSSGGGQTKQPPPVYRPQQLPRVLQTKTQLNRDPKPAVNAFPGVVQRAQWTFGQSANEMSNQQWQKSGMSTYSSILVEEGDGTLQFLNSTKNLKTVSFGAEHAEDVAMRALEENYSATELGQIAVVLNLSKSPCSSTYGTSGTKHPGCTENLIAFAKTYKTKIVITCRGLYKGLDASQQAVDLLRANNIEVSIDVRMGREKRYGEK